MKHFHFSAIRARRVFVAMFRNRMSLVEKNADAYFYELDRLGIISNFESIKNENRREAIRIDIERKNGSLVDIAKQHGVSLRTVQRESALQRKFITQRGEVMIKGKNELITFLSQAEHIDAADIADVSSKIDDLIHAGNNGKTAYYVIFDAIMYLHNVECGEKGEKRRKVTDAMYDAMQRIESLIGSLE